MVEAGHFSEHKDESSLLIERLRVRVEDVLQNSFGKGVNHLSQFVGQLSTREDAPGTNITRQTLSFRCGSFSRELMKCLFAVGVETELQGSTFYLGMPLGPMHVYLTTLLEDQEVVIDPTIGQYVEGYNHVFVGSRSELHTIVTQQAGEGKKYSLFGDADTNDPKLFFERRWGFSSVPHSQFVGFSELLSLADRLRSELNMKH